MALILLPFLVILSIFSPPTSSFGAALGTDLLTGQSIAGESGAKGRVLVFLSAECPCSNSHVGVIKKLAQDFPQFTFLAIHSNANESTELARDYFKKISLPFPVVQDENAQLADEYKALKTPHAFLLDSKGNVLYRGGVTNSAEGETASKNLLREALSDAEAGREVKVKEGRALGCVISRKKP